MSHSQFHCILFILRHAWLNLWDKHMLLAGSTRFLSFCFRTLTLTHSARPFFVRRTDERTSEEKEQEKHEGFSRFFFVCGDLRRCKLSFKRIHAHEASGAVSEHRTQRANSFCLLFVSFFPSINRRAVKAAIGRKAKAYFASRRASCFFFFLLFALGSRTLRRGAKKAIER